MQSATESLRQAEEVVVINPDRAYDLLGNAKEYINQGLETHPDNPQLADLQDRYNQLLRQILVSSELTPVVVAEVSLSPTQPTLALSEDTLYAVDGNQQAIISISEFGQVATFTKDSRITPQSLLTATNSGLIIANQGQVFPVSSAGLGQPGDMPANSSAIAMAHFESNGYTLGQDGQIYRIPRTESAISPISRYFTQPVSNTGLVDLAVDGYIYILRQDGTLERYLNGVKQPLALERSTLAKGAEAVFTPVQSQSLYLLKDNALIAWEKEGKYIGQYTLAEAGEWLMATVNDSGDTLYVLSTDSKLYSATLPQ